MDAVGSEREQRSMGRTGTQRMQQGLCCWLTVWPWTSCAQRGFKAKICLWLYFFPTKAKQENICFFYTFLVYLSWDLQLCCCCSVCFNSFEAIAVFLMPNSLAVHAASMSGLIWLQPGVNLGKKIRKNYESFTHSASVSLQDIGNWLCSGKL